MKTQILLFALTFCTLVNAQPFKKKSIQLTANLAYASLGLQYNEKIELDQNEFIYQLSFESNLYSFSRASIGIGKQFLTEGVYANVGIAYSSIVPSKANPDLTQMSELASKIEENKYEFSPEIGLLFIVNERFNCSVNTDVFQLGGYVRLGFGYNF